MSVNVLKIQSDVAKLIYKGMHVNDIVYKLLSTDEHLKLTTPDRRLVEDIVKKRIEDDESYVIIQKIINSKIILFEDTGRTIRYDPLHKRSSPVRLDFVKMVLDATVLRSKLSLCNSGYNPYKNTAMYEEEGLRYFNDYTPPAWKRKFFFDAKELEPAELPEIYREFFTFLVADDMLSYDYLLKWLAQSIKSRNLCALVTIGNQGAGKGFLGHVIGALHGRTNFSHVEGERLNNNFNSFLDNVTAVYLDEVEIKTTAQENKFKMLVNDKVEIERKGQDSISKPNYMNIYVSSNNLNAIRVPSDDRRFSIINLTDIKVQHQPGWSNAKDKLEEMKSDANIELLARYLWHLKYDESEMSNKFNSERSKQIQSESVLDWEDWFINVFCVKNAGKSISIAEVRSAINTGVNVNLKLSRKSFDMLTDKIKGLAGTAARVFTVTRPRSSDGERPITINIEKLENQPKDFLSNLNVEESE